MSHPEAPRPAIFRGPIAERQCLENELLHNLEFARAFYQDLRREYDLQRDLAAAALTHDGDLLRDHCNQLRDAMQLALDQYRVALHRFNRLVIYRELPE